jgi:Mrp family chromosome partitioning ATPase
MNTGGAEALKAAIRRSLFLIVVLVLLGIVCVNALKQLQGPRYQATSRVLIETAPLSQIITGISPSFVDPQRKIDTARALATSSEVFQRAASQTGHRYGSASDYSNATSVGGGTSNDILSFTAVSPEPDRAVGIANAVGQAYVAWRAELIGGTIERTVAQLKAKRETLAAGDAARKNIDDLLSKLEAINPMDAGDAQFVQPAGSAAKTSPAPLKDSILGFSIGLVVALLVVALREAIDTTVRSESDVEDLLAAPVLATVRSLPRRTKMVTYGRHEAAFADTYALLAANLAQSRDGEKHAVLAVTSAISREGKTTTASNLAVALARRGTRVLLADFDFRKPALSDLFQLPRDAAGALQVIEGSASLEESLWTVSLSGPRPRVSRNGQVSVNLDPSTNGKDVASTGGSLEILPSGGSVRSQAVAQSPRLAPLLKDLRARADFVILDTPPALLTVEMAELARLIDVVLVVVRQGRVTQRSLRSLGRQARSWPAELAGAVLTDAPGDEQYAYYGGR